MKFNQVEKIIDGVIENEFRHIQDFEEKDFTDNDLEYKKESEVTEALYKKLLEDMTKEQAELLDKFYASFTCENVELCKFYFKEGLRAGLSNLKFLSEIKHIENII